MPMDPDKRYLAAFYVQVDGGDPTLAALQQEQEALAGDLQALLGSMLSSFGLDGRTVRVLPELAVHNPTTRSWPEAHTLGRPARPSEQVMAEAARQREAASPNTHSHAQQFSGTLRRWRHHHPQPDTQHGDHRHADPFTPAPLPPPV